jgi:hypothetical protein
MGIFAPALTYAPDFGQSAIQMAQWYKRGNGATVKRALEKPYCKRSSRHFFDICSVKRASS